jgi:transposase
MHRYQLSIGKADILRQRFIDGEYHSWLLAKELNVSTITTWRYKREFERIRAEFPEKLKDFGFYPGEPRRPHWHTAKWDQMCFILPVILAEENTRIMETSNIFKKYQLFCSVSYTWSSFRSQFVKWCKDHIIPVQPKLLDHINEADLPVLKSWRVSNNHRLWQIAKCLDMAQNGATKRDIKEKIESSYKTIDKWLLAYIKNGLKGFESAPNPRNYQQTKVLKARKDKLIKLIHESPKLHGLNRTSWSIRALTQIYNKLYTPQINYENIRRCVHQMGYKYKKSREMLTSPDPKFREKIEKIQATLRGLQPNEKFFSIDEYGPVGIKIKGGRTLQHETEAPVAIPEKQKGRGYLICTAALEMSTNEVTWFYSLKKNTFEMIKLIDILIKQYYDQERIYLCWDAVSWHNSKILKMYVEDHNKIKKPEIRFAPLPASTQFLNVIESVFAGLARAVIHNSQYANADEAKQAIDLHFHSRNVHFKDNPKRAGRKIWGKEIVKAKFREEQNCRVRSAMGGAK